VGPLTWASLKAAHPKQPATQKKTPTKQKSKPTKQKSKPTRAKKKRAKKTASAADNPYAAAALKYGDRGAAVLFLQKELDVSPQTGFFGPITESYVKALQTAAKLPASGVVDAATWRKVGKVSFPKPAPVTTPSAAPAALPAPSNATAAEILRIAASQAGVPYVATGNSPATGFNCSSYTQWVFQQVGMDLGGAYTVWQYNKSQHISAAEAKPGDLVFFYNYANDFIGHVGIYAGNGMMWHAPRTGRVVSLEKVYTDKVYYGRVLNQ
jgi:cell wall-associated NlpC family hydrolase